MNRTLTTFLSSGADKNLENDEPLFFSSSSSDEEQEDGPIRDFRELQIQQQPNIPPPLEKEQVNPRKRPATGHTPFDLTKCQKVRLIRLINPTFVWKTWFKTEHAVVWIDRLDWGCCHWTYINLPLLQVRDLLDPRQRPKPSQHSNKKPKPNSTDGKRTVIPPFWLGNITWDLSSNLTTVPIPLSRKWAARQWDAP